MIKPERFLVELQRQGIEFFTGVPDSLLKEFLLVLNNTLPAAQHIIAANEGNAVAIGAGHHLGSGKIPLVYMQNSGLGNCINPLSSLCHEGVYSIPMVLLIGWRGKPDEHDEPQHKVMGSATPDILRDLNIPATILDANTTSELLAEFLASASSRSAPVALLCRSGTFESTVASAVQPESSGLAREEALAEIIRNCDQSVSFVCTTGFLGRAVLAQRQKLGHPLDRDFLNAGAMGHASQIALGLALSDQTKQVVCLDGDGALIMHMGGLSTIGKSRPRNLKHIVFNNGMHESVGGQPTAGFTADLTSVAKSCGYLNSLRCVSQNELQQCLPSFLTEPGPTLLELRISPSINTKLPRPGDAFVQQKQSFMRRWEALAPNIESRTRS